VPAAMRRKPSGRAPARPAPSAPRRPPDCRPTSPALRADTPEGTPATPSATANNLRPVGTVQPLLLPGTGEAGRGGARAAVTTWWHEERLAGVLAVLREAGARRVIDLGCGAG